MPFALQKSRPCMDRCEPWLSSNKRIGFSLEHLVCLTKCSKYSRKCDSFIHPDGLADPELPGGAHLRKWSRKCNLGKMKKGGTTLPVAETATAIVHILRCSFVTVLPFLSRLCYLSLHAPRHPSLTLISPPAPDWPHTFTSFNTWMYGAHLAHLTSTHPVTIILSQPRTSFFLHHSLPFPSLITHPIALSPSYSVHTM